MVLQDTAEKQHSPTFRGNNSLSRMADIAEAVAPDEPAEDASDAAAIQLEKWGIPSKPQVPFNAETQEAVLDLRALYQIPFNPDEDGISALRIMIFLKGKCLHVPGQPGKYIVSGEWGNQYAINIVHFIEAKKRPPELCISFIDYGMLSNQSSGMFVESLLLPLNKSRNVYEDTSRITKMSDAAGFSDIKAQSAPWNVHLAPALAKQPILKRMGITQAADIVKLYTKRLESRITIAVQETRGAMQLAVADIRRQDARAAEKQLGKFESTLQSTVGALKALPPSAYDTTLGGRIFSLHTDGEAVPPAGFPALTSPVRAQVTGGTACLVRTSLVMRSTSRTEKPLADRLVPKAKVLSDGDDDDGDSGDSDDDDSEDENEAGAKKKGDNMLPSKRQRRAPSRLEVAVVKPKAKAKAAKVPKAVQPDEAEPAIAQAARVEQINKRTGKPYVRGGPYLKEDQSPTKRARPKSDSKSDAKSDSKSKDKLAESQAANKLQSQEINKLKEQLEVLGDKLKTQTQHQAALISSAELKASQGHAVALLEQYKKGILDGAQIASGKPWSLGTPSSVGTPQ
jgi:hypothetical protein